MVFLRLRHRDTAGVKIRPLAVSAAQGTVRWRRRRGIELRLHLLPSMYLPPQAKILDNIIQAQAGSFSAGPTMGVDRGFAMAAAVTMTVGGVLL